MSVKIEKIITDKMLHFIHKFFFFFQYKKIYGGSVLSYPFFLPTISYIHDRYIIIIFFKLNYFF